MILFKMEREREISWNQRTTQNENEWKTVHCKLQREDEIAQAVESALSSMSETLTSEIISEFDA
jgi:hypothetical protein